MALPSTIQVQDLIRYARTHPWTTPVLGQAGYTDEPALSFANEILEKVLSRPLNWQWNRATMPPIWTNPFQQDYPVGLLQTQLGWMESSVLTDINNTSTPKPRAPVRVVRDLLPSSFVGVPRAVAWIPISVAQTGVWPGASTVYVPPLASDGGGPSQNPLTLIKDTNGNYQKVTTYGTTGTVQPTWPAAASVAGTTTTDGTVVWTVQDPYSVCLRTDCLMTSGAIVLQIDCAYQMAPNSITTLSGTFAPIPDSLRYVILQGFIALCARNAGRNDANTFLIGWEQSIVEALQGGKREPQEFGFSPASSLQGGSPTPVVPYGAYPLWWG